MNRIVEKNVSEIKDFLKNFKLSPPKLNRDFKKNYKAFHSLLIWGFCFEKSEDISDKEKMYFKEALSDLSHSLFLVLFNLYKPSRFSLRSSIENFVRALLISCNVEIEKIDTVHGLFDCANVEFDSVPEVKKRVGQLRGIYTDLCKSAHSVQIDYLSLTIPLDKITDKDEDIFANITSVFSDTCRLINQLAFLTRSELIGLAGHKNEDIIRDSVPKKLKKVDS